MALVCDFCGDVQTKHPCRKIDGKLMCRICDLFRLLHALRIDLKRAFPEKFPNFNPDI